MDFERVEDWLGWQETLHPSAIDLGLERVHEVWERLGGRPAPCVISVAGTNGKGSCVAYLDAVLREAGYRVGCYTSPHLVRYHERIRTDGAEISDEELLIAFRRVEAARHGVSLTYFEYGTLAALDHFTRQRLDVVVLEVGLGGRLDAVNLVDADVALVTTVDIDHAAWLGDDRESIGREKAGIFRRGRPAVFGADDVPNSVLQTAEALDVSLWLLNRDYGFELEEGGWRWWSNSGVRAGLPLPSLRGEHQLTNAAAVIAVLQRLADRLPVDQQAIRAGLLGAQVPGRFQVVIGTPTIVLDVAHNPEAARALARNLTALGPQGRVLAVFGALADKDVKGIVGPLVDQVESWYLGTVEGPRALTASDLDHRMNGVVPDDRRSNVGTISEAYDAALATAGPFDLVVVFGSFLVVGSILGHTRGVRPGTPRPG